MIIFEFCGEFMLRYLVIFIVLIALVVVMSCTEESEFLKGYDLLSYDSPIYTATLEPTEEWVDTYFSCYVNTGFDTRLLVGEWEGYKFRTLLQFDPSWLDIDPDVHITNAVLRLHHGTVQDAYNDNLYNEGELNVYVAPLYQSWNELDATWYHPDHEHTWEGGEYGEPVGSFYLDELPDGLEPIDIDITNMVINWISDPHSNFGCILYAEEGSNSIKEFPATETISKYMPYIVITYEEDNEKVEEIVKPRDDVTIVYSDDEFSDDYVPGNEEQVLVGGWNGFAYRTCYKFDLSQDVTGIPPYATVVQADLQLYFTPSSKNDTAKLEVHRMGENVTEDKTAGDLRKLDFYFEHDWEIVEVESQSAGYIHFYINQLVQGWVSGIFPNQGLLIQESYEDEENDILRFISLQNSDLDKKPRLVIKYTLPPQ